MALLIGWSGASIVENGIDMQQQRDIGKPTAMIAIAHIGKRGIIWLMRGGGKRDRVADMKKQPKSNLKTTRQSKPAKNLRGKRFGKWVVLIYAGKKSHNRIWLCRCDCGVQKIVFESSLINKLSTKCLFCSWVKRSKDRTKSYFTWQRLKQNGSLPKQWRDYEVFLNVVGDPPSSNAYLARYDVTKPHASGNTHWVIPISPPLSRQMRKSFKEQFILDNKMLMKIRKAKTRDEMIRCMIAARKAGHKYEMIGLAAGISRQRAHIIVTKHLKK